MLCVLPLSCRYFLAPAPVSGRFPNQTLEYSREMGAAAEIQLEGYLAYGECAVHQQLLGAGDLSGQNVRMGRPSRCGPELRGEVHAAEVSYGR